MPNTPTERVHNFSAGPASMPLAVLEEAARDMTSYNGCGMSVMEMSHRSPEFEGILSKAIQDLKALMDIPDNYQVIFMQGGATLQFAAVCQNLVSDMKQPIDYMVTGVWSQKAMEEAQKLGYNAHAVFNTKKSNYTGIPDKTSWKFSDQKPAFVYYCANETVHGVEWDQEPEIPWDTNEVPLVCDMSSNILSKPVNVSKYGVIYGGAQKNIGPAGVTVLIIRKDLLNRTRATPVPTMLDWKITTDNDSMYNTPPTWAIYISGLVFSHLRSLGGLPYITNLNNEKAARVYKAIADHPSVYKCPVDPKYRSRMNIPFRILGKDGTPSDQLEKEFVKLAESKGLTQLKGHRSVGGIRASIYNAVDLGSVDVLCRFMEEFAAKNV